MPTSSDVESAGNFVRHITIRPGLWGTAGTLGRRRRFLVRPLTALFGGLSGWPAISATGARKGRTGAIGQLLWFKSAYGGPAAVNTPEFWFRMQIAMLCGFATTDPVNRWLIRADVKERT